MKLTCTTKNPLSSIVNSIKYIATKQKIKVIVASALLIGVTGSMAMDSIVLTAPSYAKTASKSKVSKVKKRVIAKKPAPPKKSPSSSGAKCSDFATQAQAKAALSANPQLDRDKDGIPCNTAQLRKRGKFCSRV